MSVAASSLSGGSFDEEKQYSAAVAGSRTTNNTVIKNAHKSTSLLRLMAAVALVGTTLALSSGVFIYSRESEARDFETKCASYADEVVESFRSNIKHQLLALESFSVSISSYAKAAEHKWPFVTIPDFAVRGFTARQEMGAATIGFLPLVGRSERTAWESYALDNQSWISEAREWERSQSSDSSTTTTRHLRKTGFQSHPSVNSIMFDHRFINNGQQQQIVHEDRQHQNMDNRRLSEEVDFTKGISNSIYTIGSGGLPTIDEGSGPYLPIWQTSPAPNKLTTVNFNLLSHRSFWKALETVLGSKAAVISAVLNLETSRGSLTGAAHEEAITDEPISAVYYPVFNSFSNQNRTLVGVIATEIIWTYFFQGVLPDSAQGIICVVENACGQAFTFRIDGQKAYYLGPEDLHDPAFDDMVESRSVAYLSSSDENYGAAHIDFEHCPFMLRIYPSKITHQGFYSSNPALYASVTIILFVVAVAIYVVQDYMVRRSQKSGKQSVIVVERMFPQKEIDIQEPFPKRVLNTIRKPKRVKQSNEVVKKATPPQFRATLSTLPTNLKCQKGSNPFSNSTVLFMDIVGLDNWCSRRSQDEKETLMETILRTLNAVARRHGVLKVEMAGDNFLAVTGIQDSSDDDHAVIMAYFAADCRKRLAELFKNMRITGLTGRFGIHSGNLQSGIDQVNNSCFQFFGDTIDTTYQMLVYGKPNKIHVSVETAELLNLAGKSEWITPRKDLVLVKGKGEMSTFWIKPKVTHTTSVALCHTDTMTDCSSTCTDDMEDDNGSWGEASVDQYAPEDKSNGGEGNQIQHLIDFNVSLLVQYLKRIQIRRRSRARRNTSRRTMVPEDDFGVSDPMLEEATDVVSLLPFDTRSLQYDDPDMITLDPDVEEQLLLYVSSIASTYRDNPFHSFEHATHVTMAMDKMLNRLRTPDLGNMTIDPNNTRSVMENMNFDMHNRTFGISSDPLVQFGMLFAALVHDVDHVGVTNLQLTKENSPIAALYKNRCVAEQNSVDIAWWLLMTPNFAELRAAIYSDAHELQLLRQVLVSSVIATDVTDRDLTHDRDSKWKKAFRNMKSATTIEETNIRATLVIQHIIQAADSAHTMQNFHIYMEWNEKLFIEMYKAYHSGRAEKDPTAHWYNGELYFFDNHVIPLATKLRDCGAFGKSSDEYLNHALQNRKQWQEQGKKIVKKLQENFARHVSAEQDQTICFT